MVVVTKATPPGVPRDWVSLLRSPFDEDPEVVVVMAPKGAKYGVKTSHDGIYEIGVIDIPNGPCLGLQILRPEMKSYQEVRATFTTLGAAIARPAYIGRLSGLPYKFVSSADFLPMVFRKEEMNQPYFNLKHAISGMTPKENN